MKIYSLCFITATFTVLFSETVFSQQSPQGMKITNVTEYYLSADKGKAEGVKIGQMYVVLRDTTYIGKVKVVEVLEHVSVLSPTHIADAQLIQQGDLVVHSDSEKVSMILQAEDDETKKIIAEEEYVPDEYYINLGQEKADEEFQSFNYSLLGFAGGASTAIIGWGLGVLIIKKTDVEVPRECLYGIEDNKKEIFLQAYKSTTKQKRVNCYGKGALLGTCLLTVILLSSQ